MARTYATVKDLAAYYRMSQTTVRSKVNWLFGILGVDRFGDRGVLKA
ncbi:MAG: hypothetical protein HLX51_15250 [Micrococcaceae bacterium]|nr:hypothetical protein [Micrococcaceae bacterium]